MLGFGKEREKDWAAFEAEALPLMPDVFRVAQWMARDREIAEDLTQETFVQALKSFHRYAADTNCRAWLMTILYRVNGKRRQKLGQLKLVEDPDDMIAETVSFVEPVSQRLTDEDITAALSRVPEKYRHVILLADVEDFSYKETAEMMGIPIGTVMSRLHRGRAMLRNELTDDAGKIRLRAG